MKMYLYEVTFDTKKGGYTSWVRYIYADSAKAAKDRAHLIWKDGMSLIIADAHLFHVSARRLLASEHVFLKDFAIRACQTTSYVFNGRQFWIPVRDHGAPYTHERIREGVKRYETVWTDSGQISAPYIGRKYTLWCVRDCEDAIVAYDWEVES